MIFDWDFAWSILPRLVGALRTTALATVGGMGIALALGLAWAVLRRSHVRPVAAAATGVVEFIRSTPLLVQLYFLFYMLPDWGLALSPLATGVVGLGAHYSAYAAEVYRAGIEGVPRGQWEAAVALDLSPARTWTTVILPQAVPPMVPALGNYFVAMFKDTPLLAAITVVEALQAAKLVGAETFRYLEPLTLVGLLLLALSLAASRLVRAVEKRYVPR